MNKRTQHSILGALVLAFAGYITLATDRADWLILVMFAFGGFMISKSMVLEFFKSMAEYWPFNK